MRLGSSHAKGLNPPPPPHYSSLFFFFFFFHMKNPAIVLSPDCCALDVLFHVIVYFQERRQSQRVRANSPNNQTR
jgi:hypothetical protein